MLFIKSTRLKCTATPTYKLVSKHGVGASKYEYFACGTHGNQPKWWVGAYDQEKLVNNKK